MDAETTEIRLDQAKKAWKDSESCSGSMKRTSVDTATVKCLNSCGKAQSSKHTKGT